MGNQDHTAPLNSSGRETNEITLRLLVFLAIPSGGFTLTEFVHRALIVSAMQILIVHYSLPIFQMQERGCGAIENSYQSTIFNTFTLGMKLCANLFTSGTNWEFQTKTAKKSIELQFSNQFRRIEGKRQSQKKSFVQNSESCLRGEGVFRFACLNRQMPFIINVIRNTKENDFDTDWANYQ